MTALFAFTAFLGAALLFVVQPLVARMLLPSYGGSATVWSTSSLFFQTVLLLAYWYVHWSTKRFGNRWHPRSQVLLLLLPALVLPLSLPADAAPASETSPVLWLLRTLILLVALPFGVLATTGPVLQRWYSWTGGDRAADPYFLYAASNLGSFVGLLSYPFLVEPRMSLAAQRLVWSWGFVVFVALAIACAVVATRRSGTSDLASTAEAAPTVVSSHGVPPRRLVTWAALAFLPSALMLAVTSHLSTDVASIPMLWVVPLAIYLATYVLAFGRSTRAMPVMVTRLAVAVTAVVLLSSRLTWSLAFVVALNLLVLALVSYASHARLAADRPATEHLTTFYLVIAIGGALGGLLNGVIAPVSFDRVAEYPLLLLVTPMLMVGIARPDVRALGRALRANRVRATLVVLATVVVALLAYGTFVLGGSMLVRTVTLFAVAAFGWIVSRYPVLLVTGMVSILFVSTFAGTGSTIHRVRTFYGAYEVQALEGAHRLVHGTTVHGTQFLDPARRNTPTTYYSEHGPLGDVFGELDEGSFDNVGAVGLGTGTIAAYGRPGQTITFFEIDPAMAETAWDASLFSYLHDSKAEIKTVIGDGRLALEEASGALDLLVLDAFSSDSIPVHLLTTEAMRIYASRLATDGVVALHISNRVFDLEPVVASGIEQLGWSAFVRHFEGIDQDGATGSSWVVASPEASRLDALRELEGWRPLGSRKVRWTDDYSSLLAILKR